MKIIQGSVMIPLDSCARVEIILEGVQIVWGESGFLPAIRLVGYLAGLLYLLTFELDQEVDPAGFLDDFSDHRGVVGEALRLPPGDQDTRQFTTVG